MIPVIHPQAGAWTSTGPECPRCDHDQHTLLGTYESHADDPPQRVVGHRVECKACDLVWDDWVDPAYGITRY